MNESTIVMLLEALGSKKIRRSSNDILGTCPFAQWTHKGGVDNNPSFSVQVNPGANSRWQCFGCDVKGRNSLGILFEYKEKSGRMDQSLFDQIKREDGRDPLSMLNRLGDWDKQKPTIKRDAKNFGWTGQFHNTDWKPKDWEPKFDITEYRDMLAEIPMYAVDRGITPEQACKWRIGFNKKAQRLFIAILDETGKMVGYSGRSIHEGMKPKYLHAEGMKKEKYLYGECFVTKSIRVGFLMEGFMDVLNLDRLGLVNCLATMGIHPSDEQVTKLSTWFDKVIIFPHNDPELADGKETAGMKMAMNYASRLFGKVADVRIAPVVPGKKDPGDWTLDDLKWVINEVKNARQQSTQAGTTQEPQG